MERFETYCRLGGDNTFRLIAENNLDTFEKLNPKVEILRDNISSLLSSCDDPENPPLEYFSMHLEMNKLQEARDQSCIISVVFTAMYFEAFIYDYAASCLGDNYSKDHLDKLDLISKWLVIPKLITGKEISKSGQAYESLKRLNKDRNSLVHLKSRKINFGNKEIVNYPELQEVDLQNSTKNCRKALKYVIDELLVIDPDHPKILSASESRNKSNHSKTSS